MRLGNILLIYRLTRFFTVRTLAKQIGLSASTLSRVERGYAPDGFTLARILNWLMTKEIAL